MFLVISRVYELRHSSDGVLGKIPNDGSPRLGKSKLVHGNTYVQCNASVPASNNGIIIMPSDVVSRLSLKLGVDPGGGGEGVQGLAAGSCPEWEEYCWSTRFLGDRPRLVAS